MSQNSLYSRVLAFNKQAMELLQLEQYEQSLQLLQSAEKLIVNADPEPSAGKLKAVTYNNLGCVYKRKQNLQLAIKYFHKAIDQDYDNRQNYPNLAGTHLNLYAIKSQFGLNEQALQHALNAIELLQKYDPQLKKENIVRNYLIACQYSGLEYEKLGKKDIAFRLYRKALKISRERFGETSSFVKTFLECCRSIQGTSSRIEQRVSRSGSRVYTQQEPPLPPIKTRGGSIERQRRNPIPIKKLNTAEFNPPMVRTPKNNQRPLGSINQKVTPPYNRKFKSAKSGNAPDDRRLVKKSLVSMQDKMVEFESEYFKLRDIAIFGGNKRQTMDQNFAAVLIQKYWRGYMARRRVYAMLVQRRKSANMKAAKAIEELERLQKEVLNDEALSEQDSNIYLDPSEYSFQTATTSFTSSNVLSKEQAAVVIQAQIRRFLQQRKYAKVLRAAVKIQSYYRMHSTFDLFQIIRSAIMYIQAAWRIYKGKMQRKFVQLTQFQNWQLLQFKIFNNVENLTQNGV